MFCRREVDFSELKYLSTLNVFYRKIKLAARVVETIWFNKMI